MADQEDFPNIYINESVGTGGVGSESDPYSDFSEINWTTGGDNSIFDYLAGSPSQSPTINLKKGETWRQQMTVGTNGTATYPILIQAYGTGAKPVILGSEELTTWSPDTGHWTCTYAGAIDQIWFVETDSSVSWGDEKASKAACVAEYDWYSDGSDVWVFAATDPDTRYTSVEGVVRNYGVYGDNKDYITVDGVEVRYTDEAGITPQSASDNWVIKNNTVAYLGRGKNVSAGRGIYVAFSQNATVQSNIVHDISLSGIWVWSGAGLGACSGFVIEYNEVYDCYHSNIDAICGNNGVVDGGTIRYNLSYYTINYDHASGTGACYFFEGQDADDCIENIDIYYNIGFNIPSTHKGIQLWNYCTGFNIYNNVIYGSLSGASPIGGIRLDGASGTCSVTLKNNICMDVEGACLWVTVSNNVAACDYNLWYHSDEGTAVFARVDSSNYHYNDFTQFKTDYPTWEQHGLWEDPTFTDAANNDFSLQSSSPCIDVGDDVGLTQDYEGNAVPYNSIPDVGAYEYAETALEINVELKRR